MRSCGTGPGLLVCVGVAAIAAVPLLYHYGHESEGSLDRLRIPIQSKAQQDQEELAYQSDKQAENHPPVGLAATQPADR